MKLKIQFIINPISGGKNKGNIPKMIHDLTDSNRFQYDIWIWNEVDALKSHLQSLIEQNYDGVIAVGGDGTLNQVAQSLVDTEMFLGFVPMGSGNGLARQLGIPLLVKDALVHLNTATVTTIDTGTLNGHCFTNVAGIGFDAKVSKSFAASKKRGILNYGRCIIMEYRESHNMAYELEIDGEKRLVDAFMLSVANGAQWGNDFFVAPQASLNDGVLDLVIMTKPNLLKIPKLMNDLNKQKVEKNPLVEIVKAKKIKIKSLHETEAAHVDGEPLDENSLFEVEIKPLSLKVFK
jgi:diacylglycerol kinase (ATP)